ncbi:hypothetical protein [Streptomyces agglomeratus]|uniref:hypothetical protein n=1 Tax=Streptomyces agglomeratus TaxID=285458 RepID=UPI00114D1699|nr:hypothetical protein [Streptomyces agglomeratus]
MSPSTTAWPPVLAASLLALTLPHSAYGHAPLMAPGPAKCLKSEKDSRGRSSVDGAEIAWEDETKYDDARAHAVRAWSTRDLNKIKFPKDDASRVADLEWSDVNKNTGRWKDVGAGWTPFPGTDSIRMNDAYLGAGKRFGTRAKRRLIGAHELGHALGFCHKSASWYPTLMAPNVHDAPADGKPTRRDRANYQALWRSS